MPESEIQSVVKVNRQSSIETQIGRRTILTAVTGQFALAQAQVGSSNRTASSHLRIEKHGDPQRPGVAVYLQGDSNPCATIEMPEHAWRKRNGIDQQIWFYKMYGSDPKLKGQVDWRSTPGQIAYRMMTVSGYVLSGSASVEPDGIAISYEIETGQESDVTALEAPTCTKLYRPFTDVFLERTYVHDASGLQLIASDTPDRFAKNAEEWLPCRYIASIGSDNSATRSKVEVLDGVTRYFRSKRVDAPFLATESEPRGWTAATLGNNCNSVFTNPARTCHHADPRLNSVTSGRAKFGLKVYFIQGSAADAWAYIAAKTGQTKA